MSHAGDTATFTLPRVGGNVDVNMTLVDVVSDGGWNYAHFKAQHRGTKQNINVCVELGQPAAYVYVRTPALFYSSPSYCSNLEPMIPTSGALPERVWTAPGMVDDVYILLGHPINESSGFSDDYYANARAFQLARSSRRIGRYLHRRLCV